MDDGDNQVPSETAAAVKQILADVTALKRLLDDLHPAPDDTTPLRAVAAALALSGQPKVEAQRGAAEKERSTSERARLGMRLLRTDGPIPDFVRDAGLSLERLANSSAERYPYGWHLRLHVPGALLRKDPKNDSDGFGWLSAGLIVITVLSAALVALLVFRDSHKSNLSASTAGVAAVVGSWIAVALLPVAACTALLRWRTSTRVAIDLERQAPAAWVLANADNGTAAPESRTVNPGTAPSQNAGSTQSPGKTDHAVAPGTTATSLVSREPVVLGSLLTGGGTLALGLSGALGTSALGAVAAGLAAATGLLIRELVKPNPKSQ